MKASLKVVLPVVGLLLAGGGYALGQESTEQKAPALSEKQLTWILSVALAQSKAGNYVVTKNKDNIGAVDQLAALYQKAGSDPELGRAALRNVVNEYTGTKENAESAPQATQAATEANVQLQIIQVAQNQRIIELLEKLNEKK